MDQILQLGPLANPETKAPLVSMWWPQSVVPKSRSGRHFGMAESPEPL